MEFRKLSGYDADRRADGRSGREPRVSPAARRAAVVGALVAGTVLLYSGVRAHGFVNLDDRIFILDNPTLRLGWTRAEEDDRHVGGHRRYPRARTPAIIAAAAIATTTALPGPLASTVRNASPPNAAQTTYSVRTAPRWVMPRATNR